MGGFPRSLICLEEGVYCLSLLCPLCDHAEEDESHLFFSCLSSRRLLKDLGRWWIIDVDIFSSLQEVLSWRDSLSLKPYQKKAFLGVVYTYLWIIWKVRNGKTFPSTRASRTTFLAGELQARSFFWFKCRAKSRLVCSSGSVWCDLPLSCFWVLLLFC